jgi:FkbM family methyltransferase
VYNKLRSKLKLYPKINASGKGVIGLIDVGSIGELPSPWRENADKISHVLKFEPLDGIKNEPYTISLSKALWNEVAEKNFFIYKGFDGTGSSLFEQNFEYVRGNYVELSKRGDKKLSETWFDRSQLIKTTKIECTTLDLVLSDLREKYNFLKIDAQGAEYEILSGAKNFLMNDCIGIHVELFSQPLYKGIKLFPEVEMFLRVFGFKLTLKMPSHGTFESQNDCLFLKENIEKEKKDLIERIYRIKNR